MTRIVKAPDERRSELIATAQQLFYTTGYERTSVNDIVKAVGVAQGTFYYYFDSKQAILEALVAELTAQQHVLFQDIVTDETRLSGSSHGTPHIWGHGIIGEKTRRVYNVEHCGSQVTRHDFNSW